MKVIDDVFEKCKQEIMNRLCFLPVEHDSQQFSINPRGQVV